MVDKKLNKQAKHILSQALEVLEYAMESAVQKDDIDAMIGIADRLMMLYQNLSESTIKRFKPGFSLNEKEEVNDEAD